MILEINNYNFNYSIDEIKILKKISQHGPNV